MSHQLRRPQGQEKGVVRRLIRQNAILVLQQQQMLDRLEALLLDRPPVCLPSDPVHSVIGATPEQAFAMFGLRIQK